MSIDATGSRQSRPQPFPWRLVVGYCLMILATLAVFLLVREYGEQLTPTAIAVGSTAAPPAIVAAKTNPVLHVLVALLAIVVVGHALGRLLVVIGQPPVIGEMLAGILLGPSLWGRVWPAAMQFILPADVAPYLGVIAQIGIVLYMFLVGLDLNANLLRSRAHTAVATSHASIVAPFLLGAVLSLWLFPRLAPADVSFTEFALFMGVAMSITAFPVLARILTDRRMESTNLGVVALSCAATDDVTAWCLLAFVVGVAQSAIGGAIQTFAMALVFIAAMLFVVRPVAARLVRQVESSKSKPRSMVWTLAALLLSAAIAEGIGIHAIFGAFLLGAIIPHDSAFAREFRAKLEDIVKYLFLPAFFAYTGMRTEIGLVSGWQAWSICGVIILVATLGKFGGTLAAARLTGMSWRMAAALGVLMNTRGLMELVVLNIGLEMGVISPTLFAMMVIMALVTTMATTPILRVLHPEERAAAP